jgi:hypothetical protein
MMRFIFMLGLVLVVASCTSGKSHYWKCYKANNPNIRYVGRFDFSAPKSPKVWAPGAYFTFRFQGPACDIELLNELKFGTTHNYISISVDGGPPRRIRLKKVVNWIHVARHLKNTAHSVVICKDTESAIGFIQLRTIACKKLLPNKKRTQVIEFIGDSITCGNGSDFSEFACGEGKWYDHHNAYLSYGARIARRLKMDYYLSAVSGIGLTRSCCGTTYTLPEVYAKIDFKPHGKNWYRASFSPTIVCITLGQNDGLQKRSVFIARYVRFVSYLKHLYPSAKFCVCSSPMASKALKKYHSEVLPIIQARLQQRGLRITTFTYKGSYRSGCMHHPTLSEHSKMAAELAPVLAQLKNPELAN